MEISLSDESEFEEGMNLGNVTFMLAVAADSEVIFAKDWTCSKVLCFQHKMQSRRKVKRQAERETCKD